MTKRRPGRWWAGGNECQGWAISLVISREEAGNTGELEKARSRELSRETPEISARETKQKVALTQTSTNSNTRWKKKKKPQDTILNDRGESPVEMAQSSTGVKRRSLFFSGSWWSTGDSSSHLDSLLQRQHHAYERTHWERSRCGERRRGKQVGRNNKETKTKHKSDTAHAVT